MVRIVGIVGIAGRERGITDPPQVDKKRARYDTWERGLCYVSKEPFRS